MPSRDFNTAKADAQAEPVFFTLDGERFDCIPAGALPAGTVMDLMELADYQGVDMSTLTTGQALAAIRKAIDFLDTVMMPDSGLRFAARMRDGQRPADFAQIQEIAAWLFQEVYLGRPLPTPTSTSGSSPESTLAALVGVPGAPGAASTDGAPPKASAPR